MAIKCNGMRLVRFCRPEELEALSKRPLVSLYDHYRGGKGGSTSMGFCLSPESPKRAWEYLKGIVPPFFCCVYDIPRYCLISSQGKYVGKVIESEGEMVIIPDYRQEWCTTFLRLEWLMDVIPIESFVDPAELWVAKVQYFKNIARYDKRNNN